MFRLIDKITKWYYTRKFLRVYLNPQAQFNAKEYEVMCYKIKDDFEKCSKNKVLITASRMPYKDFLNTPYWFAVRTKMLWAKNYKCEICGSDNRLQIHHTSYYNRGKEIIYQKDLQVLCEVCHKKQHNII